MPATRAKAKAQPAVDPAQTDGAAATCCPSVLSEPLGAVDAVELAQGFAALADPIRLRLLSLVADAGELCACDMLTVLGKSQPTVSHHTRVLAEAGLLVGERRGRWVWWSVVPGRVDALRAALG